MADVLPAADAATAELIGTPTVFLLGDDAAARAASVAVRAMALRCKRVASLEKFLRKLHPSRPGCIVLDIGPSGSAGLEPLRTLAGHGFPLPVIVLADQPDVPTAVAALRAGALNFLDRAAAVPQLEAAIREALVRNSAGRRQAATQARLARRFARLTAGEKDVLELLLRGRSNKAIAAALGLCVRTIEVRRAKLMKKTHARSLAELVRMAVSVKSASGLEDDGG